MSPVINLCFYFILYCLLTSFWDIWPNLLSVITNRQLAMFSVCTVYCKYPRWTDIGELRFQCVLQSLIVAEMIAPHGGCLQWLSDRRAYYYINACCYFWPEWKPYSPAGLRQGKRDEALSLCVLWSKKCHAHMFSSLLLAFYHTF